LSAYQDFSKNNMETNIYDSDAIKASIMNIVLTQKGSIPGYPEFGTNVYKYLFEPLTMFTKISLADEIKSAIYKYDNRVSNVNVSIVDGKANYSIVVNIKFSTNFDKEPQIITVNLQG
jgi:phage baseplate assembly protein W